MVSNGYDDPLLDIQEDALGRNYIVTQLYSRLTNLRPEWTVRVGLIGAWGQGKTTIANWVVKKAKEDGHIVVWYNPWGVKSESEILMGVYRELDKQLTQYAIYDDKVTYKNLMSNILNNPFTEKIQNANSSSRTGIPILQEFLSISRLGIPLLQEAFKISQEDINQISLKLQGRRIIFVLDDIDRIEPELLPKTLLLIRELFNLEGFSFLLPFDEQILKDSLSAQKSNYYGENFLEKILDFKIYLPEIQNENILELINKKWFVENCDIEKLCPVIPYFPKNPRKLKLLLRHLEYLAQEKLSRHSDSEVNWNTVVFALLIFLESQKFYEKYINEIIGSIKKEGLTAWEIEKYSQDKNKVQELQRVNKIVEGLDLSWEKINRLIILCEAWREYEKDKSISLRNSLKIFQSQTILSYKEILELLRVWYSTTDVTLIASEIKAHIEKNKIKESEFFDVLLEALLNQYSNFLAEAAGSFQLKTHTDIINKASDLLELILAITKYFEAKNIWQIQHLEKFFSIIKYWSHFDLNLTDKNLRQKEFKVLSDLIVDENLSDRMPEFENVLLGQLRHSVAFIEKSGVVILKKVLSIFPKIAESELLVIFMTPGKINEVFQNRNDKALQFKLLDFESDFWDLDNEESIRLLKNYSRENLNIQLNCLDFLNVLIEKYEPLPLDSELKFNVYKHHAVFGFLWYFIAEHEFQMRTMSVLEDLQKNTLAKGIPKNLMEMPIWWKEIDKD